MQKNVDPLKKRDSDVSLKKILRLHHTGENQIEFTKKERHAYTIRSFSFRLCPSLIPLPKKNIPKGYILPHNHNLLLPLNYTIIHPRYNIVKNFFHFFHDDL